MRLVTRKKAAGELSQLAGGLPWSGQPFYDVRRLSWPATDGKSVRASCAPTTPGAQENR
jgi:hypothetical protein